MEIVAPGAPSDPDFADKDAVAFFKRSFEKERPVPGVKDLKLDMSMFENMQGKGRGRSVPGLNMFKNLF